MESPALRDPRLDPSRVGIGIVTALPVERFAVAAVIPDLTEVPVPGDVHNYRIGTLPSRDPANPHVVAVALQTQDGTRDAAAVCTAMVRSFPHLRTFIMVGIAAGVPDRNVSLGDIVVATDGVVDYGHLRRVDGTEQVRRTVQRPGADWLRADLEVRGRELAGRPPWAGTVERVARDAFFRRPGAPARPRVHRGAVGSADVLMRDTRLRDAIADDHDLLAFEMEGSGVAVGSYLQGLSWFMIRGVADHADNQTKSDRWHPYASLVAAAYLVALVAESRPPEPSDRPGSPTPGAESHPPEPSARPGPPTPEAESHPPEPIPQPGGRPLTPEAESRAPGPAPEAERRAPGPARAGGSRVSGPGTPSANRIRTIVDALLDLPILVDDYQRRAVFALLPIEIRASLPDNTVGRLHLIALVQSCERVPHGDQILLEVLRTALGEQSPALHRLDQVLRENWVGH